MVSAGLLWTSCLSLATGAYAGVRTYTFPIPRPTPGFTYEGWQAYNPETLQEPPLPPQELQPPLDFPVQLDWSGQATRANPGPFIKGNFLGLSIELAIVEAVIGSNASWVPPQFLNFMSSLKERGGPPFLRCGGNSQEKAYLVESLPHGKSTRRDILGPAGTTGTPTLLYTRGIFDAMAEVSNLLDIDWITGIPMNQSDPPRLDIVYLAEEILGEHIKVFQLGNEPDLYTTHGYRRGRYNQNDYMAEIQHILEAIQVDPRIVDPKRIGLAGICECGTGWSMLQLIREFNYLGLFRQYMNSMIVEHYPTNNCAGNKHATDQGILNQLMVHSNNTVTPEGPDESAPMSFANRYNGLPEIAHEQNLPLIFIETNTGSCDGHVGVADAFGAAFWCVDTAMQLASRGWSNLMLHVGGHGASYNAFMSPPHNASAPFMWTAGPPMYALLIMAEAIGKKDNVRVEDLQLHGNNSYVAGYTIYEGGVPARALFINYLPDATGAHDITARLAVQGSDEVYVRYYESTGLASKTNITWAGQTYGGYFESDGLLRGNQTTVTIPCTGGVCPVLIPGPSIALVFLKKETVVFDANADPQTTFQTTLTTRRANTAAVDGQTLATANGVNGDVRAQMKGKSTSLRTNPNFPESGARAVAVALASVVGAAAFGAYYLTL